MKMGTAPSDPGVGSPSARGASRSELLEALKEVRGAKVLVAEDNPVGQLLMREVLQKAGLTVEIARNGKEAVAAVAGDGSFDLVLMDIEMPYLDGYQATGAIRALERGKELPIVAMTAHVTEQERQRCLAAGMDDHVAKPIDLAKLYAALLRWLGRKGAKGVGNPLPEPSGAAGDGFPASLPGIDLAGALNRVVGNAPLLKKVIVDFRDRNQGVVSELRRAVGEGDRERARRLLHRLKGEAGNIGAEGVFETVRRLEALLVGNVQESLSEGIPPLLEALAGELALVFSAAGSIEQSERRSEGRAQQLTPLTAQELAAAVNELASLLRLNRLDAQKRFASLKRHLAGLPKADLLEKRIALLDFRGAISAPRELADTLEIPLTGRG